MTQRLRLCQCCTLQGSSKSSFVLFVSLVVTRFQPVSWSGELDLITCRRRFLALVVLPPPCLAARRKP